MNYTKGATVKFALKQSLPVLFGYLFLGSAFGIMLYSDCVRQVTIGFGQYLYRLLFMPVQGSFCSCR